MNISAAKDQIKDTIEAYLEKDDAGLYVISPSHQRPVFLLGAPGIGKTAIMEQIAQELGIGLVSYSMTHHTRQSALGLPRIEHHDFEGYEYEASEYTMSEIIGAVYDYMKQTDLRCGILFLDEINCVSETLYPSMLQFLQFKTFGKHKVPDGWVVVCAGNPPEYNKQVHEFDIVTLDRLREIDVEPDYAAFKKYAAEVGLHPAVTTFLETKKDCFYKVESRAGGGKSFVTTRGWEDLARVISLHEEMGKSVNRELIVQFLRDDEIADQFAVYYSLFEKYRSDYQVSSILAGEALGAVKQRAQEADFDERIALMGLMLDALAQDCAAVLELEGTVLEVREVLRSVKDGFLAGGTVDMLLAPVVSKREATLARKVSSGVMPQAAIRKERLVIRLLKELVSRCALERTPEGDAAFHTLERAYKEEVAKVKPAVEATGEKMTNAFAFVDECFGSREMLVFVADLATRKATTQYLAHYGNDAYYAHNDQLQVDSSRMGLEDRAALLAELDSNIRSVKGLGDNSLEEFTSVDMSGAVAIGGHSAVRREAAQATEPIDPGALAEYYSGKQFEYGFATICKMLLPVSDLAGKKVLDIGCRRGRGVYKLSAMVGNDGEAWGVDWNRAYVEESKDGQNRAWHESGLKHDNMDFRLAFPEDLIGAGIGSATFDAVYVNNVMTLFYDQEQAIREMSRVLKPGGLLIMETIFASIERPQEVIDAARAIGNSIPAARTEEENLAWLAAAGFGEPSIEERYDVAADRGYKAGETVPTVEDGSGVTYEAVSMYIYKS